MSKLIPNTFQNPNAYVDEYMHLLTGNEYKVLTYAIRRIVGFGKTNDKISVSQFADGIKAKGGKPLDHGTGLGENAVRAALQELIIYRLMIIVAPANPKSNLPPTYAIQWESEHVDKDGLEARRNKKKTVDTEKADKAREGLPPRSNGQTGSSGQTRSNGQTGSRSNGQTSPGLTDRGDNIPVETQGNPVKSSNDDASPPETPTPIPVNPPAEPPPSFEKRTPEKAIPPTPAPLTAGQTFTLEAFGRTRYGNNIQRETIGELERTHGTDRLKEAITWAAKKGMGLGEAIPAVEKALPTWGQSKPPPSHHKNGHANGSHSRAPAREPYPPAWTPEEFDAWQASEGK